MISIAVLIVVLTMRAVMRDAPKRRGWLDKIGW